LAKHFRWRHIEGGDFLGSYQTQNRMNAKDTHLRADEEDAL
jgi:hypothetical protein